MLRMILFPTILAVTVAGCLSQQTRAELDAAKTAVAKLEVAVAQAEASNSADLAALKEQLAAAQTKLGEVQTKAFEERIGDAGGKVQQGAEAASPIVAGLFPAGLIILNLLGSVGGALKDRFGRKPSA